MTLQQYRKLSAPFEKPRMRRALIAADKAVTGSVYIAYCLLCAALLLRRDARLLPVLAVCAVPFAVLSLLRKKINAPRPYEVWGVAPLLPKDTKGKSFPSRHVFSAFVIACVAGFICLPLGAAVGILGALLMVIRVIGGVHFPRDVVAGALIGILCGAAGLSLWQYFTGGAI